MAIKEFIKRCHNGVTRFSLKYFHERVAKLGAIQTVKIYNYKDKHNRIHPRVMITGTNAKMRLNGVLWGYAGEGPMGLVEVLKTLGLEYSLSEIASMPKQFDNDFKGRYQIVKYIATGN